MPFVEDDDLVALNQKIESLEEKRNRLDELNDVYLTDIDKGKAKIKTYTTVAALLSLALLSTIFLLIKNFSQKQKVVDQQPKIIRDTIVVEREAILKDPSDQEVNVYKESYGVQLGTYKEFDVNFSTTVKKILKENSYHYVLGEFLIYEEAQDFILILEDLGVKGAFIVRMEYGEIVEEDI